VSSVFIHLLFVSLLFFPFVPFRWSGAVPVCITTVVVLVHRPVDDTSCRPPPLLLTRRTHSTLTVWHHLSFRFSISIRPAPGELAFFQRPHDTLLTAAQHVDEERFDGPPGSGCGYRGGLDPAASVCWSGETAGSRTGSSQPIWE